MGSSQSLLFTTTIDVRQMMLLKVFALFSINTNLVLSFFLVSPFSAKLTRKDDNNSTRLGLDINVPLFNIPIRISLENNNHNRRNGRSKECPSKIVLESEGEAIQARMIPKGFCYGCCDVELTDVTFTVYKTNTKDSIAMYHSEMGSVPLNLHKNAPTIIYIHGFAESPPTGSSELMRNAYLSRPELNNIILMNWAELCTFPWYLNAVENVKIAGKILADFLLTYRELEEIPTENIHIIGFSLGAQVAAHASRNLKGKFRIPRITGLDPAFPGFQGNNKLTKLDADFVDIIHTDGGNFGILYPVGHLDFYPNGGTYFQPGCDHRHLTRMSKLMTVSRY